MLFFIFCWLLPSLIEIAIAQDGRFNCPNNGVPKRDDRSGRLIQCLPGRSSTAICGSDHACFFSGFNYHCCPSVRDDQEGQSREEVVSGGGADEEECPGSALVVLDSNGGPIRCTKLGQCPMPEMFCHGGLGDTSICCESFTHEKAGEQRVSKEAGTMVAVTEKTIRKAEAALEPNMGTTSTPSPFALPNIIIKSQSDIRGKHEIRQNIADNEIRSKTEKDNETESQRESVEIGGGQKGKNLLDDSFNEIHNISSSRSGDYASSRNGLIVEQEAKTVGQEQLAKQFLLEQIRRGWPYNEKFYRPKAESEDIFVLRKRGKPQAIVHFPN